MDLKSADLKVKALASLAGWEAVYRPKPGVESVYPVVAIAAVEAEGSEDMLCVLMGEDGPYLDTDTGDTTMYRRERGG